jgi:hypothetical protein
MHSFIRHLTLVAVSFSLIAFLACGGGSAPEPEPKETAAPAETVGDHMKEHFTQVKGAQEAVIRGDLEELKTATQWMADHEAAEGLPDGWEPYVTEMKNAAQAAGAAADLDAAAAAVATMGKACGACHQNMGTKPVFTISSPPPEDTGTVPHMVGHMWAADRMWEGLITPSDESWNNGTGVLAGAPLHGKALTGEEPKEDIDALAKQVHELATKGSEALDLDARAEIYGQFLATCAKCHQGLGKGGPK